MTEHSILLVEDNPMDVDLALRAFSRARNDQVLVARDGEEALSWMSRWESGESRPAVILLDLKLPRVDGLEVLRRFKSHPSYRAIPIVVLTSSGEQRDLAAAYRLGANSYIIKPVDFDRFVELAERIAAYWTEFNETPETAKD